MKIEDIFVTEKCKQKINGYTHLQTLDAPFGGYMRYYAHKFNNLNLNLLLAFVDTSQKRDILIQGTKIVILDIFMMFYLKERTKYTLNKILEHTINYCEFSNEIKSTFSNAIPKDFNNDPIINEINKDGFKILYVQNNKEIAHTFNVISAVFVKEEEVNNNKYIIFRSIECKILPKSLKNKTKMIQAKEFAITEFPIISLHESILKNKK